MKNSFKKIFFVICCMFFHQMLPAQNERKEIRKGNSEYKAGKFSDAELDYRKAIEKNSKTTVGHYNLGDALYRQQKFEEAAEQFKTNTEIPGVAKNQKSNASFNLGNSLLKAEKYEESIEAYKNALKSNPKDEDARYNLAYAQSKLLQKQQQEQQQNKDQDKNKDKNNKDKQNQQQQDKKDQEKKNEDQQEQAQNKQEEKQQQPKQPKISKEDAERMLQALKNDEKNLQKKLAKKDGVKVKVEKDW